MRDTSDDPHAVLWELAALVTHPDTPDSVPARSLTVDEPNSTLRFRTRSRATFTVAFPGALHDGTWVLDGHVTGPDIAGDYPPLELTVRTHAGPDDLAELAATIAFWYQQLR